MRTFIHPDRNREGPFLWLPIPKTEGNPAHTPSALQYWAFTGSLPSHNHDAHAPANWGNDDLRALRSDRSLRFRLVPTKSKTLDDAINDKLAGGYVETHPGLAMGTLHELLTVIDATALQIFDPNIHLSNDSLELMFYQPSVSISQAVLDDWRRAQLVGATPWG